MRSLQYVGNQRKTAYRAFYPLKHLCQCPFHWESLKTNKCLRFAMVSEKPPESCSAPFTIKTLPFSASMCDLKSVFGLNIHVCMCECALRKCTTPHAPPPNPPPIMSVYCDLSGLRQYQCHRPGAGCIWLAPGEDLGALEVSGVAGVSICSRGSFLGGWVAVGITALELFF